MNISNISLSVGGISASPSNRTKYHLGVIADIPLAQSFYVQTGLYLQNKGYKLEQGSTGELVKPVYLEIPVLGSYRSNICSGLQLQIDFGPYFAYGVGGKAEVAINGYEGEFDVFGDGADQAGFKRFNCGLQVGAGLTLSSHYYLGFAYQFGLTNMVGDNVEYDDYKVKDRNWMLSLGYNF